MEGKLDALLNLVTQLAVNQKPASVHATIAAEARHSIEKMASNSSSCFGARNDVTVIRGVHDVATVTSAETRKVEGKLDALVNLVTQLAMNQKPASVARVCGIILPRTTIQKSVLLRSNLDARNDAIVIRGVHDVATDTSVETRKVEGKLDALVNLVTQLVGHHRGRCQTLDREDGFQLLAVSVQEMMSLSLAEFTTRLQILLLKLESARNDAIVIRGVHDVATDTSVETRKVEGKLDALVNLVTQLVGHHSSRGQTLDIEDGIQLRAVSVQKIMPLSLEEFRTWLQIHLQKLESARNNAIVIIGVHDVATDTSAETRKVEGKLDARVNLVSKLAVNQKPASVARGTTAAEARHLIEKMASNS
ncbi:hypothetical protein Fmac_024884 [Flemingia macrophylla]|uniref:Uncharacterized protein n=1 Tax=Flemingia macrophylla TaxID=520843 RepID=A0ABD1LQN7_9FABA